MSVLYLIMIIWINFHVAEFFYGQVDTLCGCFSFDILLHGPLISLLHMGVVVSRCCITHRIDINLTNSYVSSKFPLLSLLCAGIGI